MKGEQGGIFFRLLALLVLLCFLAVLYVVRRPILRAAGWFWVVDEPPQQSDAIIILSDDNFRGERASLAATLYRAGWAPRIIASGRQLRSYASIAELMQHDLVEDGVPAAAVIRFPHRASDTREEAKALSNLLAQRGWKRILLVTSNYHTRRARYICSHAFPPGTELRVIASHDSEYDPNWWWESRKCVKTFFSETLGMMVAVWEMHRDPTTSGLMLPPSPATVARFGSRVAETFPPVRQAGLYLTQPVI
jgi:uncharacterized SAM-binding protein YcdF (DUF218 family)